MWATFLNYTANRKGRGVPETSSADFTTQDKRNLMSSSCSVSGQNSRRKLMLAVAEDTDSFRHLQQQLRERRAFTHLAVQELLKEDSKVLDDVADKVMQKGVTIPPEKQNMSLKAYRHSRTSMNNNSNGLLNALIGLVPSNTCNHNASFEPRSTRPLMRGTRESIPDCAPSRDPMFLKVIARRSTLATSGVQQRSTMNSPASKRTLSQIDLTQKPFGVNDRNRCKTLHSGSNENFSSKRLSENLQIMLRNERQESPRRSTLSADAKIPNKLFGKFMVDFEEPTSADDVLFGFPAIREYIFRSSQCSTSR